MSSRLACAVSAPGGGTSTSQGHARTIFRRALERGNLLVAEATAKEIGRLSLAEALELTLLIARKDPRAGTRASPPAGFDASSTSITRPRSTKRS